MNYLIWDFDGTLAYREGRWSGALLDVLKRELPEVNCTADHLRVHLQAGFPWHTPDQPHAYVHSADQWWERLYPCFERVLRAVPVKPGLVPTLARQVRDAYIDADRWHLYKDTFPVLDQLTSAGWKHLLLSNHVPELGEILCHTGIARCFDQIFNSASTGYEKPHPRAFQNVLDIVEPDATLWMIGDNPVADIAGAAANGIEGILVRRHHPGVRHFCENLYGVAAIVGR